MGFEFRSALIWPGILLAGIGVFSPDMTNEIGKGNLGSGGSSDPGTVFATYAETNEQLHHVLILAESIREFSGCYRSAPIWVYLPGQFEEPDEAIIARLHEVKVAIRASTIPEETAWFFYAGKVYAAGLAEKAAEQQNRILVWLDDDTIILTEPTAIDLPENISVAYRPVMHNRSGTLYGEEPTEFWRNIYHRLHIRREQLFPMTTPADNQVINAYFNAGLIVVRPELGILRGWGESFSELCRDGKLVAMCRDEVDYRIFLHQTALVGAILHRLSRDEMYELSDRYNYPIFFKRMFGADTEFDSLDSVVTLRYDMYFRNPDSDWAGQLTGPARQLEWLKLRLGSTP